MSQCCHIHRDLVLFRELSDGDHELGIFDGRGIDVGDFYYLLYIDWTQWQIVGEL